MDFVRGRVLRPGDEGFDTVHRPWNLVGQDVTAVVEAADIDDVAALVRHANENGLQIATQAGGHGASGNAGGAVLLRLDRLNEVRIDPVAATARAGAGVRWGAVQEAAAAHGLTGLAGSSPIVSATGYTLGGGLSWFGRAFGWAADSVTAFEVVTADGERSRVTDGDLFWALRGGGGDYAIVTAIEFGLHPAPELYGGRMIWPLSKARQIFLTYAEITAAAPEALTLWLGVLNFPGMDPLVTVDVTYLGPAASAVELLRPFENPVSDSRRVLTPAELGQITADPVDPSAAASRSLLLNGLDDVEEALLGQPLEPVFGVQLRHLGGALAGPSATPFGPLTEPYYVYALGAPGKATYAGLDELTARLGKSVSHRKPYFALSPSDTVADAFDPGTLDRLRAVKRRHDPRNVLRANYPVV
ncbi:FAD-binding oxidoreductase [Paractinoplanes atraurantiacus]|uniref:FAD/FMN-containing dehydrogenase n=1 Tax=Paractinoplanes atraurantiacus TaxID=1036182 RepID=A0A285K3I2_9ACTN|nr:FAD-binding oxidoreductase [Actinoplanes atraurantiacus]SNY65891.1 FAD/FMN-containing dehydrogenase [Actinoplanes atraurantiacus]